LCRSGLQEAKIDASIVVSALSNVTFFVSFDSEVFPHGAEKFAKKSRPEKSAAEKIPAWQGST
jgi:hypothetical protein